MFVQVQERHSASPICFNLTHSLYSSPVEVVASVITSKLSADNPTMANDEKLKIIKEYKTRYWLQAFGCEERLFGVKPLIQSRVRFDRSIDERGGSDFSASVRSNVSSTRQAAVLQADQYRKHDRQRQETVLVHDPRGDQARRRTKETSE